MSKYDDIQDAIENHGFVWMSWLDIPTKSDPDYPKVKRVRQLMSPDQMVSQRWIDYWSDKDPKKANLGEPLSYAYCSSGGGVTMTPGQKKALCVTAKNEELSNEFSVLTNAAALHTMQVLQDQGAVSPIIYTHGNCHLIRALEPTGVAGILEWHVSVSAQSVRLPLFVVEAYAKALVPSCCKWSAVEYSEETNVAHIWGEL